jgi:hypothetical protein
MIRECLLEEFAKTKLDNDATRSDDYTRALTDLTEKTLVMRDRIKRTVSVPGTVQAVTQLRMSREHYQQAFATSLRLLVKSWPSEVFGWRQCCTMAEMRGTDASRFELQDPRVANHRCYQQHWDENGVLQAHVQRRLVRPASFVLGKANLD